MSEPFNIDPRKKMEQKQAESSKPQGTQTQEQEKSEQPHEDRFKFTQKDVQDKARLMAQSPKILGRKIVVNRPFQQSTQPVLRSPPRLPTSRHYEFLIKDPAVSRFKESKIFKVFVERSQGSKNREPKSFSTQDFRDLFRMRHQVKDPQNLRDVLRYLVYEERQARRSNSEAQAQKTGDFEVGKNQDGETVAQHSSALSNRLKELKEKGESPFERALKSLLGGQKKVEGLPLHQRARFASKSQEGWKNFFSNVLSRGSREQSMIQQKNSLAEALYRGLYKEGGKQKGMLLISDLHFQRGGRIVSDKFARILVKNQQMIQEAQKMQPGDLVSQKLLSQSDSEIRYTKLVHISKEMTAEARDAARQATLTQLRSSFNPTAHAKMEQNILQERQRRHAEKNATPLMVFDDDLENRPLDSKNSFYLWNDFLSQKMRFIGKPRFWIFFSYSIGAILAGLFLYVILRML